ncbi:MAG: hypothetical protein HY606_06470 [Planctomycetes bacterium]|nr:hypothetical protein [Planctomycetota bacterium]
MLYEEHQWLPPKWVLPILAVPVIFIWYAFIVQVVFDKPFGTNPAPDWALTLFWLIFGLTMPALLMSGMATDVDVMKIRIRYFPLIGSLSIAGRSISHSEIEKVEECEYNPVKEYCGWGIKTSRKQKGHSAYTVSGDSGVKLHLKNGQVILVGSQRSKELAKIISERISQLEARNAQLI